MKTNISKTISGINKRIRGLKFGSMFDCKVLAIVLSGLLMIMSMTTLIVFGISIDETEYDLSSTIDECEKISMEEMISEITTSTTSVVTTSITTTTTTNTTTTQTSTTTTTTVEQTTTVPVVTTEAVTETTPIVTTEEFMVYKPSTHYVHRSTCRWCCGECYVITCEEDIGEPARLCSECCPPMGLCNVYEDPIPEPVEETVEDVAITTNCGGAKGAGLTDSEIQQLRNIVSYEYGSDWVSVYDKACIVCGVMNLVRDPRYPNTITEVLSRQGTFPGFNQWGSYYMSDSICQAVDYYFDHPNEFGDWNSWWGDGQRNHFYRS